MAQQRARQELLPWSGVAAVVVTILAGTVLADGFSWRSNALSNLGVTSTDVGTQTTVVLFNGGLIAGGGIGLAFGYALLQAASTRGEIAVLGLGLAVPEILGALAFGAWVCRRSVALAGSPAVTNR